MGLSIIPLGGYGEVGRNCTAVKVDDDVFLLDLGLHLDNYVRLSDEDDVKAIFSKRKLIAEEAVPNINLLGVLKHQVKAICISHAHLDHVGAVPYLANSFDCDVYGTPFTMEVAKRLAEDKRSELRGNLISCDYKKIVPLTDDVSVEFVEVTHSTPQTAIIVLHTPYGKVVYCNDFKLDNHPVIGHVTDMKRLSELKPKLLIIDTLYADLDDHTPGEDFAEHLLESALLSRDLSRRNIIVTTFSSHISRLKSLASIASRMNRKIVFVGRSMAKYLEAAHEVGISDLIVTNESIRYGSKVRTALSKISHYKEYMFVVTGGMAEPRAVLSRIVDNDLIPFHKGDLIIFSNRVIPTPGIIEARRDLERDLIAKGYEVLRDLHVSGHGAGHDHTIILDTLKPEIVVPVHGEKKQRAAFVDIALASGMKKENILVLKNGERVDF